jgi:hypothetical protein
MSENSETYLINEILVIVTFGIMVISIAACVMMYVFRDYRKKEVTPNIPPAQILTGRRKTSSNRSRDAMSADSRPSSIMKKEGSVGKKDKRIRIENNVEEYSPNNDESETVALIPDKSDNNISNRDLEGGSSMAPKDLNNLVRTSLSDGVTFTLHTTRNSRSARISLIDGKFICRIKKMLSLKVVQIDLQEIRSVRNGKETPNFQRPGLQRIEDDNCFSIVTETRTFDFEATSRYERDAFVTGISSIVEEARQQIEAATAEA